MQQERPSPNFDVIAPVYDGLARLVYGKAQQRAQRHFISQIPEGAKVLIVGGGTGWILVELLKTVQTAEVLYLEASAKMIEKAEARLQKERLLTKSHVTFRLGTQADLLPDERFHVVMTPFVLDLFSMPETKSMMHHLNSHLLPAGLWLHTDFHEQEGLLYKVWQKPLLWTMYRFFGLISAISGKQLPAFNILFQEQGLVLAAEAFYYGRFICTQKYLKPVA